MQAAQVIPIKHRVQKAHTSIPHKPLRAHLHRRTPMQMEQETSTPRLAHSVQLQLAKVLVHPLIAKSIQMKMVHQMKQTMMTTVTVSTMPTMLSQPIRQKPSILMMMALVTMQIPMMTTTAGPMYPIISPSMKTNG